MAPARDLPVAGMKRRPREIAARTTATLAGWICFGAVRRVPSRSEARRRDGRWAVAGGKVAGLRAGGAGARARVAARQVVGGGQRWGVKAGDREGRQWRAGGEADTQGRGEDGVCHGCAGESRGGGVGERAL